jgi:hypothetical protein
MVTPARFRSSWVNLQVRNLAALKLKQISQIDRTAWLEGVVVLGRCVGLPLTDGCDARVGVAFVFHDGVLGETPCNGFAIDFVGREVGGDRFWKIEMSVHGPLISNLQEVVLEGALQGLGILYSYDDDRIYESIAAGRLKRVLADWSPTFPGLFLYYSNRHHPQPALRAFIDCLLDRRSA